MTTSAVVELAAREYGEHGDPVFPVWHAEGDRCGCRAFDCQSPAKHPIASLAPEGLKNATTDPAVIGGWWARFPEASVAMRTGMTSTVLDVDPAKGGRETLARLEAEYGPLPLTPKVLTGGGGEHYHFAPVAGLRNSSGKVGPGLDIRGEDGYVLLPPSTHVSGGVYLDDLLAPMYETPRAPMPAWLVSLASSPTREHETNGHRATADEWAEKLAGAPEGQRRAVALQIAGHYLGLHIAAEEVTSILVGYAARCVPPFSEREARELVRDLARRDERKRKASPEATAPPAAAASAHADGPVLIRLADVAPEPVEWLWPGRFARGKLSLIIGEPGEGKSYLTHDLAARTTRGLAWPDGGRAPVGSVIILASEDGIADTVRPRVDRQGGDSGRVYVLRAVRTGGQEAPFTLEANLPALEQALTTTQAIELIIDPLSAYLGSKDSYKDAEIRGLLSPLAGLAERSRLAIVGILHMTKANQRKLLLRAQGTVAFVAQARTVLAVGEDPAQSGRRLLVPVKNNLGPAAPALAFRIGEAGLAWEAGTVEGTAEALLVGDDVETRSARQEREDAGTFLRRLLAEGPVASRQVEADAKANGIAQRTLWRAKAELGIVAERGKSQDGKTAAWYWMLSVEPLR